MPLSAESYWVDYYIPDIWDTTQLKEDFKLEFCIATRRENCVHDRVHIYLHQLSTEGFRITFDDSPRLGSLTIDRDILNSIINLPVEFEPDDGI